MTAAVKLKTGLVFNWYVKDSTGEVTKLSIEMTDWIMQENLRKFSEKMFTKAPMMKYADIVSPNNSIWLLLRCQIFSINTENPWKQCGKLSDTARQKPDLRAVHTCRSSPRTHTNVAFLFFVINWLANSGLDNLSWNSCDSI